VELALSHALSGRRTEYPAAVISNVLVRAPSGRIHSRRWEAVIDTGADLTILPINLAAELRLVAMPRRARVWTYRKDDEPRDLEVYHVQLGLPSNLRLWTYAILSSRRNILIGRSALLNMRLTINWPAHRWSLEEFSFGNAHR
jgi:predicted aspartyl protease